MVYQAGVPGRLDSAAANFTSTITLVHRMLNAVHCIPWLYRQVYLGGYEAEEAAAEAYDIAVLKTKGTGARTNFPADRYADLLASFGSIRTEELIMAVRRQSQVRCV